MSDRNDAGSEPDHYCCFFCSPQSDEHCAHVTEPERWEDELRAMADEGAGLDELENWLYDHYDPARDPRLGDGDSLLAVDRMRALGYSDGEWTDNAPVRIQTQYDKIVQLLSDSDYLRGRGEEILNSIHPVAWNEQDVLARTGWNDISAEYGLYVWGEFWAEVTDRLIAFSDPANYGEGEYIEAMSEHVRRILIE